MPKNTVSDPITDQEMAFAHLVLSGTMNDRRAAEAVGLNPDTAAYTKSKPRVRAYMLEHRAAVREKLVDQEADLSRRAVEDLRKLNMRRDEIRGRVLDRLWELATLSHEATRGSIAGQMKALAMIVAIEGLTPDRRMSRNQPVAPPAEAQINTTDSPRAEQSQAEATDSADVVATPSPEPKSQPHPTPKPAGNVVSHNPGRSHSGFLNPFINPEKPKWVPGDAGSMFDAAVEVMNSIRLPFSG